MHWRESGEIIREREQECLWGHAKKEISRWFTDDEAHLVALPIPWLAVGITDGYDPARFTRQPSTGQDSLSFSDAFGLMAIAYEEPSRLTSWNRQLTYADSASFV